MNELLKLGINEQDVRVMLEVNSEIFNLTDEDVRKRINKLFLMECDERIIRNIIQANPLYLNRSCKDIDKLVLKLKELGMTRLNLVFDSNPWLLNYDDYEIAKFIENKLATGMDRDMIIDLIEQGLVE